MKSKIYLELNANGTLSDVTQGQDKIFQGAVDVTEYHLSVKDGITGDYNWRQSDVVYLAMTRPDGQSGQVKMTPTGDGWVYTSNGWETDVDISESATLTISFLNRRYSLVSAGTVASEKTTEEIELTIYESSAFTPRNIEITTAEELEDLVNGLELDKVGRYDVSDEEIVYLPAEITYSLDGLKSPNNIYTHYTHDVYDANSETAVSRKGFLLVSRNSDSLSPSASDVQIELFYTGIGNPVGGIAKIYSRAIWIDKLDNDAILNVGTFKEIGTELYDLLISEISTLSDLISANTSDIENLQTDKLDKKPNGTDNLINTSINKINDIYLPAGIVNPQGSYYGGTFDDDGIIAGSSIAPELTGLLIDDIPIVTYNGYKFEFVGTEYTFSDITYNNGDYAVCNGIVDKPWSKVDNSMPDLVATNIITTHENNTLTNTELNAQADIDELDDKIETLDGEVVKTISLNGGTPIAPTDGNVDLTVVKTISTNGGTPVEPTAGNIDLTISSKKYADIVIGTSIAGHTADEVDYLCDGTDDGVEIQAAIDSLTNGGRIIFLNGTYVIGTAPTGTNLITVSNSKIYLDGGKSRFDGYFTIPYNIKEITIFNFRFEDWGGTYAINIDGSGIRDRRNIIITENEFNRSVNGHYFVKTKNGTSFPYAYSKISGITISNNTNTGYNSPNILYQGTYNSLFSCTIENNKHFDIIRNTSTLFFDTKVINNEFYLYNGKFNIYNYTESSYSTSLSLINNIFESSTLIDILTIPDGTTGVVVIGNVGNYSITDSNTDTYKYKNIILTLNDNNDIYNVLNNLKINNTPTTDYDVVNKLAQDTALALKLDTSAVTTTAPNVSSDDTTVPTSKAVYNSIAYATFGSQYAVVITNQTEWNAFITSYTPTTNLEEVIIVGATINVDTYKTLPSIKSIKCVGGSKFTATANSYLEYVGGLKQPVIIDGIFDKVSFSNVSAENPIFTNVGNVLVNGIPLISGSTYVRNAVIDITASAGAWSTVTIIDGCSHIDNIKLTGTLTDSSAGATFNCFANCSQVSNCNVNTVTVTGSGASSASIYGYYDSSYGTNNRFTSVTGAGTISATGGTMTKWTADSNDM